jgi:hypothetical protein
VVREAQQAAKVMPRYRAPRKSQTCVPFSRIGASDGLRARSDAGEGNTAASGQAARRSNQAKLQPELRAAKL